jgi:hypothetical protein
MKRTPYETQSMLSFGYCIEKWGKKKDKSRTTGAIIDRPFKRR